LSVVACRVSEAFYAAFAGKKPALMPMRSPLFAEQAQGAFGQGDITVAIAFARADVQEPALGIDVADLEVQAFAQAQAAGINGDQANAVIEGSDLSQDLAHFLGGEHDREFELRIGSHQLDFGRPGLAEGFFPEEFDRADGLGGSLAGEFLLRFEMEEVLTEFFGGDQVGGFAVMLAEFADARPVAQRGAFGQGQQTQVIEEAI
jgi:hypothetical protein